MVGLKRSGCTAGGFVSDQRTTSAGGLEVRAVGAQPSLRGVSRAACAAQDEVNWRWNSFRFTLLEGILRFIQEEEVCYAEEVVNKERPYT